MDDRETFTLIKVEKNSNKDTRGKDITYYINEQGCYICNSHFIGKDGYPGPIRRNGVNFTMHAYVYSTLKGNIGKGLVVRHTCDNPSCINPNHMILGSQKDNINDMVSRDRQAKGEKNGSAKLTEKDINFILEHTELSCPKLAGKLKVHQATVWRIRQRKNWKHIRPDLGIVLSDYQKNILVK